MADSSALGRRREGPFTLQRSKSLLDEGIQKRCGGVSQERGYGGLCGSHSPSESGVKVWITLADSGQKRRHRLLGGPFQEAVRTHSLSCRQCGQGFPVAKRSRPSSCGLAAPVHPSTCQAAALLRLRSSSSPPPPTLYPLVMVGALVESLLEPLSTHLSIRASVMATIFRRSWASGPGTLEAVRDS